MSSPKQVMIKETVAQLRKLQKDSIPMIDTRISVLLEFKKREPAAVSKRVVADLAGVSHNSVQTWRTLYISGGIEAIIKHEKKGAKPSQITAEEHILIEKKLQDPKNGLRGYVELLTWVEAEFNKTIKYNTLLKYTTRHFGSKVKVARKSHVKKDEEAVIAFKKTSLKSAGTKAVSTRKPTKR